MSLTLDWERRIQQWMETMAELFYEPLDTLPLAGHMTYDQFAVEEACGKDFTPVSPGTKWGAKWQYGWFRTTVTLPEKARGKRIVFRSGAGSECAIYVDGIASGAWDQHHKEITLARKGIPGTRYEIMIEAYGYISHVPIMLLCGGGPAPYGKARIPESPAKTQEMRDPQE